MQTSVTIQTSPEPIAAVPAWFGEVVLMVAHLKTQGLLAKICEHVQFRRRRFGLYEVIDFLAVLFGYAISGERTLEADLASGSSPSPFHSWPCLSVTSCQPAQRSHAF